MQTPVEPKWLQRVERVKHPDLHAFPDQVRAEVRGNTVKKSINHQPHLYAAPGRFAQQREAAHREIVLLPAHVKVGDIQFTPGPDGEIVPGLRGVRRAIDQANTVGPGQREGNCQQNATREQELGQAIHRWRLCNRRTTK